MAGVSVGSLGGGGVQWWMEVGNILIMERRVG